jgi:hypothetical protein
MLEDVLQCNVQCMLEDEKWHNRDRFLHGGAQAHSALLDQEILARNHIILIP